MIFYGLAVKQNAFNYNIEDIKIFIALLERFPHPSSSSWCNRSSTFYEIWGDGLLMTSMLGRFMVQLDRTPSHVWSIKWIRFNYLASHALHYPTQFRRKRRPWKINLGDGNFKKNSSASRVTWTNDSIPTKLRSYKQVNVFLHWRLNFVFFIWI